VGAVQDRLEMRRREVGMLLGLLPRWFGGCQQTSSGGQGEARHQRGYGSWGAGRRGVRRGSIRQSWRQEQDQDQEFEQPRKRGDVV
jgi:hypothetical protein